MKHRCIKTTCNDEYESEDQDAYYCPKCLEQKNAIAEAITAKMGTAKSRPVKTALREYDEAEKAHGFMRIRL